MSTIADRVKTLRKAAGLTQAQFAEKLHFSRDYISQIEGGRDPGARFKQQIELIERIGMAALSRPPVDDSVGIAQQLLKESALIYGDPILIAKDARRFFEETLSAAGKDTSRLGWVREQLRAHLAIPSHWQGTSPLVPVTLPSQTQLLSSKTGKPIQSVPSALRSAQSG